MIFSVVVNIGKKLSTYFLSYFPSSFFLVITYKETIKSSTSIVDSFFLVVTYKETIKSSTSIVDIIIIKKTLNFLYVVFLFITYLGDVKRGWTRINVYL